METDITFLNYYNRAILELKKNKKRNEEYFETLDLLINTFILNSDFNEEQKIDKLKCLLYINGSLSEKQIEKIDKEFGIYEESNR